MKYLPRIFPKIEFILAVDPALSTGIALFQVYRNSDNGMLRKIVPVATETIQSYLLKPYSEVFSELKRTYGLNENNLYLAIETWTYARNLKTVLGLGKAQQRVFDALEVVGCLPAKNCIQLVNANKWQAAVLGHNHNTKKWSLQFAVLLYPDVEDVTEDVADAVGIGHYTFMELVNSQRGYMAKRKRSK